jgi:heme/copper-type cytochrome/quinol oxidase subunit 2
METPTSDLVVRLARMGSRLEGYATALSGLAVTGAIFGFIVGFVVILRTRTNAAGAHTHPFVAIGVAIWVAGCLLTIFVLVLSHIVEVIADYVSAAHLIEVSDG